MKDTIFVLREVWLPLMRPKCLSVYHCRIFARIEKRYSISQMHFSHRSNMVWMVWSGAHTLKCGVWRCVGYLVLAGGGIVWGVSFTTISYHVSPISEKKLAFFYTFSHMFRSWLNKSPMGVEQSFSDWFCDAFLCCVSLSSTWNTVCTSFTILFLKSMIL